MPRVAVSVWRPYAVPLALLVIWAAVVAGVPHFLPVQMASWLTFLALFITPGYLLAEMLLDRLELDGLERWALAFPLGVAVLSIPGMWALLNHHTVRDLALGWMGASTLVVIAWLLHSLWRRQHLSPAQPPRWTLDEWLWVGLLALAFLLLYPTFTLFKIDGDAYAVSSFTADALAGMPLNQAEPLFGTGLGPGVRMVFNQSLPMTYLWVYFSGIDPITLTATASRAMVALWAILAAYMLGKAAGVELPASHRGRRFGLLVAGLQLLIYTAAPFFRGDNVSLFFFERTTADKFMVPVTLLPVAFALSLHYLRQGRRAAWLGAALVAFAVSAIHPLIAAMLALALGALGASHWLLRPRWVTFWRSAALALVVAVTMALPLVQLVLSRGEEPLAPSYPASLEGWPVGQRLVPALPFVYLPTLDVYGPLPDLSQLDADEANTPTDPFLIWRFAVNMNRRRLILFDLDHYISDPNIVLEPPYLLALLLLPLLLRRVRSHLGAQFAVGVSLAVLFVMFNPLVTPRIGQLVMPWILWRFVWLLPYTLVLGWAAYRLAHALAPTLAGLLPIRLRGSSPLAAPLVLFLVLALLLSPAAAGNLQELHHRAAFPYYYPTPAELFRRLDELTTLHGPAAVMADPDLSVTIPAYVAGAHIIAHRAPTTSEIFPANRQAEALQRLIDQDRFYRQRYLSPEGLEILRRYQVGYVVAISGSSLDLQLRLAPQWFQWITDDQSYSLYAVRAVPDATYAIQGNQALAERQWATAARLYEAELAAQPESLLALYGLAEVAHARGQFRDALALLQQAESSLERQAAAPGLRAVFHYRQGQIYMELGQPQEAMAAFDQAQRLAPRVARFHLAAGDACLRAGEMTCTEEQYTLAVTHQHLPDDTSRLVALADLWRQRGETDRALALYAQAANQRPSLANQLTLASAYREAGRFDEADALVRLLRQQHPLSVDVLVVAADVKAAQADYPAAVDLYRRAIWLQELTGQESVETRLALAQVLLDAQRYDEAGAEIDTILARQPNNALAHGLQGDRLTLLHRPVEATLAYQRAFRLDPTQVRIYLALNDQFRRQGGAQEDILALLQTAIRANPNEPALALALGDQLQRQGDIQAAVDAYQAALDMFETDSLANTFGSGDDASRAYAYVRLAAVSEDLGQMEPAMNYYKAAEAAAPDLAWPAVMLGDALRRRGDMDGARLAYQRGLRNDPTFVNGYLQLADLLYAQGQMEEAQRLQEAGLQVALDQTLEASLAAAPDRLHLGLGKVAPDTAANPAGGFDSDGGPGNPSLLSLADVSPQAITRLFQQGNQLLGSGADTTLPDLLSRLYQEHSQAGQAIALYRQLIEEGERERWYPVTLAQFYKGLGDLLLAQGQALDAARAYQQAVDLDAWWPQARLGLAQSLMAMGDSDQALDQLRSATEMAPGYVEAQVALADLLSLRGEEQTALAIYQETAATHPGNPRATLALAQAWQTQGQLHRAEQVYRETLRLTPGEADAYVGLATLLLEQARYDEAAPLLQKAIQMDQRNIRAYLQYGVLEQRQGNPELAMAWFSRARDVQARGAQSGSLVLVDLLQRYGNYEPALAYVQEMLQGQPDDLELLLRAAQLQRALGRYSDALATLLTAARYQLNDSRLSAELGELYWLQGRPQAALAAYRHTLVLQPDEYSYYLRLSEMWNAQADFQQATQVLRAGLQRAVSSPLDAAPLYAALASLYLQQGNAAAAKETLDTAFARLGENETELIIAMGGYLASRPAQASDQEDAAEKWYNDALARQPGNAALHRALAAHLLRQDRQDEALHHYRQAVALEPTNASHRLALAELYAQGGQPEEAIQQYSEAIRLEPTLADAYSGLAAVYESQKRWDEAEAVLKRGLAAVPTDGPLYIRYAGLLWTRGDAAGAQALLRQAEQVSATATTLMARSALYARMGQKEQARRDLEAALQKEPGNLDVLLALGDLYRDQGDVKAAQEVYQKATTLKPGVAAGRLRLSRLRR